MNPWPTGEKGKDSIVDNTFIHRISSSQSLTCYATGNYQKTALLSKLILPAKDAAATNETYVLKYLNHLNFH